MKKKYLGKGQNAKCYLVDGRVYKKYRNKYIAKDVENNIIKLSKYDSNTYTFPEELKHKKDDFIGYYMLYRDGKKINNIDGSIDIDNYMKAINIVEYDTAYISLQKILICDAGLSNTIYGKDNRIYFIDPDYYLTNINIDNIYSKNLYKVSYPVLYPFFDIYSTNFMIPKLNTYLKLVKEGKMLPSNFLYEVKSCIERECNENINNLDEFRKTLKLIR